jgi:hypothetical protein
VVAEGVPYFAVNFEALAAHFAQELELFAARG